MATLDRLPLDIRYEIFKYSYKPQKKSLLKDIENVISSYNNIIQLYEFYERKINNTSEELIELESLNWLSNNIDCLIQDKVDMKGHLNGTTKEFIDFVKKRSFILKNKPNHKIINIFVHNDPNRNKIEYKKIECKFLWSLLTIDERQEMIINLINDLNDNGLHDFDYLLENNNDDDDNDNDNEEESICSDILEDNMIFEENTFNEKNNLQIRYLYGQMQNIYKNLNKLYKKLKLI
jgi:hypothetical protein